MSATYTYESKELSQFPGLKCIHDVWTDREPLQFVNACEKHLQTQNLSKLSVVSLETALLFLHEFCEEAFDKAVVERTVNQAKGFPVYYLTFYKGVAV